MADHADKQAATEQLPELDQARREALAKMGRFAGYTAPAMLALLGATKVRAAVEVSPVNHKTDS